MVVWLLMGAVVGLLSHRLRPGGTPGGRAGSVVAGVLGALLAGTGFVIVTGTGLFTTSGLGLLAATAGAVAVVGLFRMASGTTDRRIRSLGR